MMEERERWEKEHGGGGVAKAETSARGLCIIKELGGDRKRHTGNRESEEEEREKGTEVLRLHSPA